MMRDNMQGAENPTLETFLRALFDDSVEVRLFSSGGPATVGSFAAWQLAPANPY